MSLKKTLIPFVSLIFFTGCGAIHLITFKKSPFSGSEPGYVIVVPIKPGPFTETSIIGSPPNANFTDFSRIIEENDSLRESMKESCLVDTKELKAIQESPPLIFAAAAQLGFDLTMDYMASKAEKLKKASQVTYTYNSTISGDDLKQASCLVALRWGSGKFPSMASIVKINKRSDLGFTFTPAYARVKKAIAVTKEPDEINEYSSINMTYGLSIKTLSKQTDGNVKLVSLGEGAATINKVLIGESAPPSGSVHQSELIPYPYGATESSTYTLSIIETGNVGFDLDQAATQAKAIKAALGPAIKDSVKNWLTEDPAP